MAVYQLRKEGSGMNVNELLSDVLDLAVVCPHDNSNPPFCPLYKVRKLGPDERIQWALLLTDEEMEDITINHQVCQKCRSTNK